MLYIWPLIFLALAWIILGLGYFYLVATARARWITTTVSNNESLLVVRAESLDRTIDDSNEFYRDKDGKYVPIPEAIRKDPERLKAFKARRRSWIDNLFRWRGVAWVSIWYFLDTRVKKIPIVKVRMIEDSTFNPNKDDLSKLLERDNDGKPVDEWGLRIRTQRPFLIQGVILPDGSAIDVIVFGQFRLVDPELSGITLDGNFYVPMGELVETAFRATVLNPERYDEETKKRWVLSFGALSRKVREQGQNAAITDEDLIPWTVNLRDALNLSFGPGSAFALEMEHRLENMTPEEIEAATGGKIDGKKRTAADVRATTFEGATGYTVESIFVSKIGPNRSARDVLEELEGINRAKIKGQQEVELAIKRAEALEEQMEQFKQASENGAMRLLEIEAMMRGLTRIEELRVERAKNLKSGAVMIDSSGGGILPTIDATPRLPK